MSGSLVPFIINTPNGPLGWQRQRIRVGRFAATAAMPAIDRVASHPTR